MTKNANIRFLAFMLAFALILSVIPVNVLAVEMLNTTVLDGKIKVSTDGVSGKGSAIKNNDGTITVTSQATANCKGTSYSYTANAHTVYVTNNTTDETLMVDFSYAATNLGTLTIDGVAKTAVPEGSYSKTLEPGEAITIVLTSPATGSGSAGHSATIVLSDFELMDTSTKTVTVVKTDGGSVTVNGTALTAETVSVNADYATGVAVKATPASGYVFLGWFDSGSNALSTLSSDTIHPLVDMIVAAVFVPNDTQGYWLADGTLYTDLNQAAADAAKSSDKTVVLLKSATLTSGTYTIPAGVKLVIPKDEAVTTYGAEPALSANGKKFTTPVAFRTLTLASGAKLVVNGELELVAQHHVSSGSGSVVYGGAIDGAYGHIAMAEGSAIEVYGTMYAWGVVSGEGVVTAYSGGTIHEKMQINDYRGGTATSSLVTTYASKKLFPFSQYYVQNVEVKEVIHSGATLMVNAGVYLSAAEQASVNFVGGTGSMFTMAEGAYVTKEYDEVNDRLVIDVYGNTALSSISMSFNGQSVDSSSFRLGINNNIDIRVHSGVTTISQEMVLQAGATVTVDREATIYNATSIYVMDAEDWGTYARGKTLMPVMWSYANGTTVKRTGVTDAIVDINGTVINAGYLFTSGSESIISSQKTGVYALLNPATSSSSISQLDHNSFTLGMTSDWETISFTAAVLVNGDGTTLTAEGAQYDAYIYDSVLDRWVQQNIYNEGAGYTATVTFDPNGGTGSAFTTTVDYFGEAAAFLGSGNTLMNPYSFVAPNCDFTREGYTFIGWSDDANATEAKVIPGQYITISANTTLYAVWSPNSYSLIIDGVAQNVPVGSDLSTYVPAAPSKDGFKFLGWSVTLADGTPITTPTTMPAEDIVFTSNWEEIKEYTLTFLDENGEVLDVFTYMEGEQVTDTYPAYSKDNYVITWSAEIPGTLTGDVEITAIATPNVYILTFWSEGNTIGEAEANESNNWTVDMIGDPTKTGYTFLGWATSADATAADETYNVSKLAMTGDLDLYAVWSINTYTVTWNGVGDPIVKSYKFGDAIVAPADPVMQGYNFLGWYDDNGDDVPATMPAENLVFYAEMEQIIYTVTFDTDGDGDVDYTENVAYGAYIQNVPAAIIPEMTVSTVYSFGGWTEGSTVVDTTALVYGDLDLTAWIISAAREYTITFVDEDGTVLSEQTVAYGELPTAPANPSKDATAEYTYTFTGWNPEVVAVTGDATYTAQYEANAKYYFINFYNEDGTSFLTKDISWCFGTAIAWDTLFDYVGAPEKEGHNFAGWLDADGNPVTDITTMPAYDVDVYASFEPIEYTITFMNGDQVWTSTTCAYGGKLGIAGMPVPSKEGHSFAGWYTDDGIHVIHGMTITSDVVAYATWTVNTYTITWIVDGVETQETYAYGKMPEFTGSIEKAQNGCIVYTFDGWDNEIVAVTGDATYTATYTESLSHTEGEIVVENEVAADCINGGSYDNVIYCSVCGEELSRETIPVDALGHTPGETVVENNVAPDCVNPGSYDNVIYCSVCGEELSRETIPVDALGHTPGETVVENNVAPDCVNPGSYDNVVYCAVCDAELSRETITVDALGHTPGETVVENNVAPDCDDSGSYENVVYCSVCDAELSRETITVDALGHTEVIDEAVAPDCTNTGLTAGSHCSVCGEVLVAQETVDALGHSYSATGYEWAADYSSCTVTGTCGTCGDTVTEEASIGYSVITPANCVIPAKLQFVGAFNAEWAETQRVEANDPAEVLDSNVHAYGSHYVDDGNGMTCTPVCNACSVAVGEAEPHNKDTVFHEGNCIQNAVYRCSKCTATHYGPKNPNAHPTTATKPVNNGDGTHTMYYPCCDTPSDITVEHTMENYYGTFGCSCGELYNGIFEDVNGDLYFVENGAAVENKGLVQAIDENGLKVYYYFGCGIEGCSAGDACLGNFLAQKSCRHYAGITNGYLVEGGYTIGDDGIIEHVENLQGIQTIGGTKFYLIDGVKVAIGLVKVDGEYYYARSNGALVVGQDYYISKTNGLTYNGEEIKKGSYTFDADGKIVWTQPELKNGIYAENGSLYYYVDGAKNYAGLIYYTGDLNNADGTITEGVYNNSLIYVNTHGEVKNNCTYWISKNNGLIAKNQAFTFDANGIVMAEKNGFYFEDGYWYYYVDGSKNYAGLIWCDGPEGNDPGYYYVNSKCQLITDCSYWISKNNGYMKNQSYTFGVNGKMEQLTNDSDELLNGFVEEDGDVYYYENGVKTYAGLILIDGNFYYVNSKCQLVRDCTYWISKNNGYMKNAAYTFDANGVMVTE